MTPDQKKAWDELMARVRNPQQHNVSLSSRRTRDAMIAVDEMLNKYYLGETEAKRLKRVLKNAEKFPNGKAVIYVGGKRVQ